MLFLVPKFGWNGINAYICRTNPNVDFDAKSKYVMLKNILKILLPFALGAGILWWMYRDADWMMLWQSVTGEMKWSWMIFSFVFGALAMVARAWRWRLALEPLGEQPRMRTATDAVMLSYAASLVVPRIGEVTRCGTLKRMDGTPFTKALGTVVTERIVDSLLIMLLTMAALVSQLPVFLNFVRTTGVTPRQLLDRFTQTGYIVTVLCLVALVGGLIFLASRYAVLQRGRDLLHDIRDAFCLCAVCVAPGSIGCFRWPFGLAISCISIWLSFVSRPLKTFRFWRHSSCSASALLPCWCPRPTVPARGILP